MDITVGSQVTFTTSYLKSHPGVAAGTFIVIAITAAETSNGPSATKKVYTLRSADGGIRHGVVKSGLKLAVKSLTRRPA
jgi:hypothetical protein